MDGPKNNGTLEIVPTSDGSLTIYHKKLKASYHSKFGAMQESRHIFLDKGLSYIRGYKTGPIKILEVGFGTGLNTYLTLVDCSQNKFPVHYTTIEKYPLTSDLMEGLNYAKEGDQALFKNLHACNWEKLIRVNEFFSIQKVKVDISDFDFANSYDLVYFDAFGPETSPEMWTEQIFQNLFKAMSKEAVLVTFCAKGEIKRLLKRVGFVVETLQGPPGKREMVRAIRP